MAKRYWLMKSDPDEFSIHDLKLLEKEFPKPLPLADLRKIVALKDMLLLRKGNRLSVMPVTAGEFRTIGRMAGLKK